jgi:P4 family phage/plasmid primase-like protien
MSVPLGTAVPVLDYARATCFPDPPNAVRVRLMPLARAIDGAFSTDAHLQCCATTVARRIGNKAIGLVPITIGHLMGDLDDPIVHAENASRKARNKLLKGKPLLDSLEARPEWRAKQEPKLHALAQKYPRVFIYPTRGGYRPVFALKAAFPIETRADAARWREVAYPSVLRMLRVEFGLELDGACADFCHLFRLPFVRREFVRDGAVVKERQAPDVYGDPADLEKLDLEDTMKKFAPRVDPRVTGELRAAAREVKRAPHGKRHQALIKHAYALGGYVPTLIDRETVFETLFHAIMENGGDAEGDATKINEQIDAGMAAPRDAPTQPERASRKKNRTPPPEGRSPQGSPEVGGSPAGVSFSVGDQTEMATALLAALRGTGPELVYDEGGLYRVSAETGIWGLIDEGAQSRIVQGFSGMPIDGGDDLVNVNASDVSGARKLAGHRMQRDGFFTQGPAGIAFTNGFAVVTATGVDLRPLTPDMRARHAYEFPFQQKAHPTKFLKFLGDVWRGDADKKEKIALIQEFAGLSLTGRAPSFAKCIVAIAKTTPRPGEENGSNGKSTLGKILEGVFRREWVTHIPPQLFSDQYRRAQLAGKRLNIVGELPEADIMESEAFKAIITGDPINARPIREAPFDVVPQAGHFYSCNTLPGSSDLTYSFFRRFTLLTFNRTFRPGDGAHVPDIDKIILAAETEQIVCWFLEGAVRALAQGHYTIPASHERELAEWKRTANQVVLFVDEQCVPAKSERPLPEVTEHDWAQAASLYSTYVAWCNESGHKTMARNKFSSRLKQAGHLSQRIEAGAFYALTLRSVREKAEKKAQAEAVKAEAEKKAQAEARAAAAETTRKARAAEAELARRGRALLRQQRGG